MPANVSVHPYLNFDGNTEEAMRFYAAAIGGDLTIRRMGDSPFPVHEDQKNRVMHATLAGPTMTIMASDTMHGQTISVGNAVHLSLNFGSADDQTATWNRLSEGAMITMPLGDQFFGRFGMLTDRFGISWMLHHNKRG